MLPRCSKTNRFWLTPLPPSGPEKEGLCLLGAMGPLWPPEPAGRLGLAAGAKRSDSQPRAEARQRCGRPRTRTGAHPFSSTDAHIQPQLQAAWNVGGPVRALSRKTSLGADLPGLLDGAAARPVGHGTCPTLPVPSGLPPAPHHPAAVPHRQSRAGGGAGELCQFRLCLRNDYGHRQGWQHSTEPRHGHPAQCVQRTQVCTGTGTASPSQGLWGEGGLRKQCRPPSQEHPGPRK